MSVQELETAVKQLNLDELLAFAEWFAEYQANLWDKQIEEDVNHGRLDHLLAEVDAEYHQLFVN